LVPGHCGYIVLAIPPVLVLESTAGVAPEVDPIVSIVGNLNAGVVVPGGFDAQPPVKTQCYAFEFSAVYRRHRGITRAAHIAAVVAGKVVAYNPAAGVAGDRVAIV
jgi:hypothetical protein